MGMRIQVNIGNILQRVSPAKPPPAREGFSEPVTFQSSNIRSASYNLAERILEITFSNGGTYQYRNVPQEVFAGLLQAPSAGRYVARQIKNRYPVSRT